MKTNKSGGRTPRIELETPIRPGIVAWATWLEACAFLDAELPCAWVAELAGRAGEIYERNEPFRQLLRWRSDEGRDWLWAFTQHWLSALILKHRPDLHARLPDSYHMGHPLPSREIPSPRPKEKRLVVRVRRHESVAGEAWAMAAHFCC